MELAGGVGLIPGFDADPGGPADDRAGLPAIARLVKPTGTTSSEDIVSGSEVVVSGSSSKPKALRAGGSLAASYLKQGRFAMEDCLEVLECEKFRKTAKQRAGMAVQ